MRRILDQEQDEKGREFTIFGDTADLEDKYKYFIGAEPDDEEYGINHVTKGDPYSDDRYSQEERDADERSFRRILRYQPWDWKDVFDRITRKKNGTFAKGRVITLHRGDTFAHYWEDSYGFNAPEVRIKTLDDFTAELELSYITQGY